MENIVTHGISLLGGGVLVAIITAFANRGKTKAEAENLSIKSLLEVDERMSARLNGLEERLARYEEKNAELRDENIQLKEEISELKLKIRGLEMELNGLKKPEKEG